SAVRAVSVMARHWPRTVSPSQAAKTIFVFPASIANSKVLDPVVFGRAAHGKPVRGRAPAPTFPGRRSCWCFRRRWRVASEEYLACRNGGCFAGFVQQQRPRPVDAFEHALPLPVGQSRPDARAKTRRPCQPGFAQGRETVRRPAIIPPCEMGGERVQGG